VKGGIFEKRREKDEGDRYLHRRGGGLRVSLYVGIGRYAPAYLSYA